MPFIKTHAVRIPCETIAHCMPCVFISSIHNCTLKTEKQHNGARCPYNAARRVLTHVSSFHVYQRGARKTPSKRPEMRYKQNADGGTSIIARRTSGRCTTSSTPAGKVTFTLYRGEV